MEIQHHAPVAISVWFIRYGTT